MPCEGRPSPPSSAATRDDLRNDLLGAGGEVGAAGVEIGPLLRREVAACDHTRRVQQVGKADIPPPEAPVPGSHDEVSQGVEGDEGGLLVGGGSKGWADELAGGQLT